MKKEIMLLIMSILLSSCGNTTNSLNDIAISHNTEFNCIDIHSSADELKNAGFELGDSLDFTFSNGHQALDIPYFDGYYIKKGELVFCAYPTYKFPCLTIQFAEDLYEKYECKETDKVNIKLNTKGKYEKVQKTLSMKYSLKRDEYESDEIFANFRDIECGNIKHEFLYRSASPVDNSNNRAKYVCDLIKDNSIQYIFDLSNNSKQHESFFQNPEINQSWKDLYQLGHVYDIKVNANFTSQTYYPKMKHLAEMMASADGKCLFHCAEGKDRTGFVAILLEALCGASMKEITDDYFVTYQNYYNINETTHPDQISLLKDLRFYEMTNFLVDEKVNENATNEQLYNGAVNYLKKCGVSEDIIIKLINNLSTKIY